MLLSVEVLGEHNSVIPLSRGYGRLSCDTRWKQSPDLLFTYLDKLKHNNPVSSISDCQSIFSYNIFARGFFFSCLYEQSRALGEELLKCLFPPYSPFFPSLPPPACVMFIGVLVIFSFLEPAEFPQNICYPGKPRALSHLVLMCTSPYS